MLITFELLVTVSLTDKTLVVSIFVFALLLPAVVGQVAIITPSFHDLPARHNAPALAGLKLALRSAARWTLAGLALAAVFAAIVAWGVTYLSASWGSVATSSQSLGGAFAELTAAPWRMQMMLLIGTVASPLGLICFDSLFGWLMIRLGIPTLLIELDQHWFDTEVRAAQRRGHDLLAKNVDAFSLLALLNLLLAVPAIAFEAILRGWAMSSWVVVPLLALVQILGGLICYEFWREIMGLPPAQTTTAHQGARGPVGKSSPGHLAPENARS